MPRHRTKRAYAHKELTQARLRGQISDFVEPAPGMFVVSFNDSSLDWRMDALTVMAFVKGLRVGHAYAREQVFA